MDRHRGSVCRRTHARQNESGSDSAARRAFENICETAGVDNVCDSGDHSGRNSCSQREPNYRGKRHARNRESHCGSNQPHAGRRKSLSNCSSYCHTVSGSFAVALCEDPSFSIGFAIDGSQRDRRARRHRVSDGICIALRQGASLCAHVEALAIHCPIGFSRHDCYGTCVENPVAGRANRDATGGGSEESASAYLPRHNQSGFVTGGFCKYSSNPNSAAHDASSCYHTRCRRNAGSYNRTCNDSAAKIHSGNTHRAARGYPAGSDSARSGIVSRSSSA